MFGFVVFSLFVECVLVRRLQVIAVSVIGSVAVIGAAAWVWFRRAAKRDQVDLDGGDASSSSSSYERLAQ